MNSRELAFTAVTNATSKREVLETVGDFIEETLEPTTWWIHEFDPNDRGSAVGYGSYGLPISPSMLAHVRSSNAEYVIEDATEFRSAASTQSTSLLPQHSFRSMAFVPIAEWGMIILAAEQPAAFDDDDVERLAPLADLCWETLSELMDTGQNLAEQRLDEIGSTLSHDMGQPIAIARGNLDLVLEEGDMDRLETVDMALERISQLTHELETLATTGGRTSDSESVEVAAVAQLAWELCEEPGTYLEIETEQSIIADRKVLCHLLENLFRNAIEHGATTISVGPADEGIYVEDDGPGIPEEIRDAVFDRGFSTKAGHSGRGLNIVHDLVRSQGWEIAVEGGETGGAKFVISEVERA